MQLRELREMVESTSDAAFAIDGEGYIVVWNQAAGVMFGVSAKEAVGKPCGELLEGMDECGPVCSSDCTVQQAVRARRPVTNFDIQAKTDAGRRWCNVSVMSAEVGNSKRPYAIHIVRPIDTRKRLEMLVRDFMISETKLPEEQVKALVSATRSPARQNTLSGREIEVLRLLGKGATTSAIAGELHVSRTTVNNHIQHILRKLCVHTRLEAIRRAEVAGLI